MIADDDPIFRQLPFLAPDRLRLLIAHAGGLLAHHTSHVAAATVLDRVALRIREDDPQCSMRGILSEVSARAQVTIEDLRGPSSAQRFARPRHEAMWLMRQVRGPDGLPRFSFPQIGRFLGGRDHTTVMHGVRRHQERIDAQREAA